MNDSSPTCPDCGAALPTDSPQSLCPACLMRQALASRTIADAEENSAAPPLSPEEISDRFPAFEILDCLGRGGMGVVYKARQKSLNRLVAIKILAPERENESRFAERFAREAEMLAQLNHPHIVTIHDFGVAESQPSTPHSQPLYYLVMEFVDGVNLRDLLRDGKLESKQALAIVPPICEALQYAHDKGIVHRDIKPENLLLDRDGRIKIADFGIASLVGSGGESSGTPPYMAPEQAAHWQIDHRADIYALGVVFYEMLTGERPGKDLVAPSRKVQLDVRIDEMVLRALEKEPEKRYQTAGEFRTVVETMAAPSDIPSSGPPPVLLPSVGPPAFVMAPAIAMMIVSGYSVFSGLIGTVMAVILLFAPVFHGPFRVDGLSPLLRGMVPFFPNGSAMLPVFLILLIVLWMLIWFAGSVVAFIGGLRMCRLRASRLSFAGAVILIVQGLIGLGSTAGTMNSGSGIWPLLGLGVGIWALVILLRPEVKALLSKGRENPLANGPGQVLQNSADPAKLVAAPAIGLMVASGLNLLLLALGLLALLLFVVPHTAPPETKYFSLGGGGTFQSQASFPQPVGVSWRFLSVFVIFPLIWIPSILTYIGAWRLRRLRGYGMAIVAAVLAIITPPGMILGVIFGIWALVVLSRDEVRKAFDQKGASGAGKGCLIATAVVVILLVLAVLSLLGIRFLQPRQVSDVSVIPMPPPGYRDSAEVPPPPPGYQNESGRPQAGLSENETNLALALTPYHGQEISDLLDPATATLTPTSVLLNKGWVPDQITTPVLYLTRDVSSNQWTLTGTDGVMTQTSSADQWDTITNFQALETIRRNSGSKGFSIGAVGHGDLPQTFLFKTFAGEVGILQIISLRENPHAVNIRYKRVTDG